MTDSGGDRVGEREQIVEELTAVRFEAEDGRERELGVEGRSSTETAMANGGLSSVLGRFGRGRGSTELVEDWRSFGARLRSSEREEIDRGRRSSASGTSTASSARFRSLCSEEGERRNGTGQEASRRPREEKSGVGMRWPTRGGSSPVWRRTSTVEEQDKHSETQ